MGELPKGWTSVELSKVTSKITDGTQHSPENLPSGDYVYVTAKNIRPWGLDLSDVTYVTADVHREIYKRCPVEQGDVLYIKDGATTGLATINHLNEPFSLLSSVALLKPLRDVLDPSFLKYSLNSPDTLEALVGKMTGTAIRRLTLRVISSQKIALPPLPEQKRIVAKIDSLTARTTRARKELDRVPSLISQYKQRLLALAFSGELTGAWREHAGKSSEWSRKPLGGLITDIVAGKSLRCEERPPHADEKGVVKVSSVTWGVFDPRGAKTLPPSFEPPEKTRIAAGDFLISRANTLELVAAVVIVKATPSNLFLSDKILKLELADAEKQRPLLTHRSC